MEAKKKRPRLPNGFGQISEIKNRNLKKPFRALVTVGKNQSGKPIVRALKPVSYFSTYEEAFEALKSYQSKKAIDVSDRSPFSKNEIDTLFKNIDQNRIADIVLIQCYTGLRYQEISKLPISNIDIESGLIHGGLHFDDTPSRRILIEEPIKKLLKNRVELAVRLGWATLLQGYTRREYTAEYKQLCCDLLGKNHGINDPSQQYFRTKKEDTPN